MALAARRAATAGLALAARPMPRACVSTMRPARAQAGRVAMFSDGAGDGAAAGAGGDKSVAPVPTIKSSETRAAEGGVVTHPWSRYNVNDDDHTEMDLAEAVVHSVTSMNADKMAGSVAQIFSPSKDAMTSGKQAEAKWWTVRWEAPERWSSPLMGYMSGHDTTTQIAEKLRFETKEQAILFCKRNGWAYETRDPESRADLSGGKKDYGFNFLFEPVKYKMGTLGARKAKQIFFNPKGFQDTWVNRERSSYGKKKWDPKAHLDLKGK